MIRSKLLFLISAYLGVCLGQIANGQSKFDEPKDVRFVAGIDGTEQFYVVMVPKGYDRASQVDVVIALHGHGSDRWQFVRDERDECRASRDFAAEHAMIFVSPDYRAKTSWMGPKAEVDLVQIIDRLKTEYRVGRIILCGGSMGGTGALTFAALHPDKIDAVVSMNGTANLWEYDKFQDAISESFGGGKDVVPQQYRSRSAELHIDKLTMPIASTVGLQDDIVPAASVVRMSEKLQKLGRKNLLIAKEDCGHSTAYDDAKRAFRFVYEQLNQSK